MHYINLVKKHRCKESILITDMTLKVVSTC
nr:MAG TPA: NEUROPEPTIDE Y Receptor selective NPY mutant [Caudoviricetes sp.]